MVDKEKILTLNDLSPIDKTHWQLHLNAALKSDPSLKTQVDVFLEGGALPDIKHPAYIHDWLEQPERRVEIEAYNG